MSFVFPSFLWALPLVAVPIIIHLFHFRRYKTVFFTNVRFLREIKEESSSRQKLRNLLILSMRCLAVIALVFAFAQPFIAGKDSATAGRKEISIFIDNSFSMQAASEDVPLLEKAKQRATEIIQSYEPEDQFQILTTDFEGRDQRLLSREDALERVGEIKVSHSVRTLTQALARQQQALKLGKSKQKHVFLVSDFQKNIAQDLNLVNLDSNVLVSFVPLEGVGVKNVSIDSAWFEAPVQIPNQTNVMVVKLRNHSDSDVENVAVSVKMDGATKPAGILNIPANSTAYDSINITVLRTGWHQAEIQITDYPVEFDDHYFTTFYVEPQVDVLQVATSQPNKYVSSAFAGNPYFKLTEATAGQLDYSKMKDYELIVLSELTTISTGLASELANYVRQGGNVAVFPSPTSDLNSYKVLCEGMGAPAPTAFETVARQVSQINFDEFVFKGVFRSKRDNIKLPDTRGNLKLGGSAAKSQETLLRYRDGGAFLNKYVLDKGNFYLCAAPLSLDFSNLVQNGEIFVPMLYKMSLARGAEQPLSYIIGKDVTLETENRVSLSETNYKMKGSGEEFIPSQRPVGDRMLLGVNNSVTESGFYNLFLKPEEITDQFAFNYDRRESALAYMNKEELETAAAGKADIINGSDPKDFGHLVTERSRGTALWKWCILLVLIALAAETALLRLWKG